MRLLFVPLALAFGVGAGFAGETPSRDASAESSISSAKRDLDAIKAARESLGREKAELPKIATPELHVAPGATPWPTRDRASKAQLEAEKRSKNWLLQAMEKEKKHDRSGREDDRTRIATESERVLSARDQLRGDEVEINDENSLGSREAESATKSNDRRADTAGRPAPPANPLAGFMADWMTSRDFALLQPNLAAAGGVQDPSGRDSGGLPAPGLGAGDSAGGTGGELFLGVPGPATGGAPTSPAENPYLQALVPPGPSEVMFAPPPPPMPNHVAAPNAAPVFIPASPAEAPPTRSKIPEFAKPSTDEKYFKQLKRF